MALLHTQYEMDGGPVLFQCTECGYVEQSLGALHAHIERHRGYTRWNIQVPFTSTAMANGEELMKRTEVLRVRDTETVELSDVPEFGGQRGGCFLPWPRTETERGQRGGSE